MNFLEKLDALMGERGLNRKTLSEACGVPYTTIIGFYSKGYEGTRMSTVKSLAHFFGVSTDYLIRDEITDPHYGLAAPQPATLAADEQQLVDDYRSLNEQGQKYIRQTMYMAKQTYKKMLDLSGVEKQT